MININDYQKIGRFTKPHGIKGELTLLFTNDIFDRADCDYIVCLIDNIPIPFFIEEYRFKGNESAIFKLEDIDNEDEAKLLAGYDIYYPKKYLSDCEYCEYSWDYFINFEVMTDKSEYIGIINNIDDSTYNVLFSVINQNKDEILIPANEELITEIDHDRKKIYMTIPEGLLHL